MIPTVGCQPRLGLLTKNHLLLSLLILLDGRIPKDHDHEEFWTRPPKNGKGKNNELFEVLERGLMVVVLDKRIWTEVSPEDIQLINDVDNQEEVTNLADHEVHMLNKIGLVTEEQERVDNPNSRGVHGRDSG